MVAVFCFVTRKHSGCLPIFEDISKTYLRPAKVLDIDQYNYVRGCLPQNFQKKKSISFIYMAISQFS